ncbi:MAG: PHP domain-containing protein [Christensenellales bacterium]
MDLHVHTTFSDGDLTPVQTVQKAIAAGLDAVAITDHDECRAPGTLSSFSGIGVIPGIELSAQHNGEVHVLGLGIDINNEALRAHIENASNARRVRVYAMIDRLSRAGIAIRPADVEAECRGKIIGRPHMAAALVGKGYAKNINDAFAKYLSDKTPYYVSRRRISVERAAALILNANGLPVLAHPGLLSAGILDSLEPALKALGFWGIEAYHPVHSDSQCAKFECAARQNSLYVTSGSDYHGRLTPVEIGCETRGGQFLQKSFNALIEHIPYFSLC